MGDKTILKQELAYPPPFTPRYVVQVPWAPRDPDRRLWLPLVDLLVAAVALHQADLGRLLTWSSSSHRYLDPPLENPRALEEDCPPVSRLDVHSDWTRPSPPGTFSYLLALSWTSGIHDTVVDGYQKARTIDHLVQRLE